MRNPGVGSVARILARALGVRTGASPTINSRIVAVLNRGSNDIPATRGERTFPPAFVAIFCLAGVLLNTHNAFHARGMWSVDFNQFLAAGRLAGTGHLYDWDALQRAQAPTGPPVPTGRLPVVAFGFKILGPFSFRIAAVIWLGLSAAALILFAARWPMAQHSTLLMMLAWSPCAAILLALGQDTSFFAFFYMVGIALLVRRRPMMAGLAFALCINKFHLALGIPVMLIAQRQWRTLLSGAGACAVLIAACTAIEGWSWPRAYANIARLPQFSPAEARMPNLLGIAYRLPGATGIEIGLAALVLVLLWRVSRSYTSPAVPGAAAMAAGLLVGHHAYIYDCILLLPILAHMIRTCRSKSLRWWALLLATPLPYYLVLLDWSVLGQTCIVGFPIAAMAWLSLRQPDERPRTSAAAAPGQSACIVTAVNHA